MDKCGSTLQGANGPTALLRILEARGPQSQRQLAKELGLTFAGVSFHFQKMLEEGMVHKVSAAVRAARGRPPALWDIDRQRNATIGISINPPEMTLSLCDFADRVICCETHSMDTKQSLSDILGTIDAFLAATLKQARKERLHIRQVFIGVPGHLDAETGRIIDCPNLPALTGVDFERHLRDTFGLNAMTQASTFAIYASESEAFGRHKVGMLITWELGLGILFGCHGDIFNYLGQSGQKYRGLWDLGHTCIVKNGKPCTCGKHGCLEAYVAGWAMLKSVSKINSLEAFLAAVHDGNTEAHHVFCTASRCLGGYVANLVQLMGVEHIVIAGALADAFDVVRDDFIAGLHTLLDEAETKELGLTVSHLPTTRVAIGASRMAKSAFLYPETLIERRRSMGRSYASG